MDGLTAADPRTVGEFRLLARLGAGGMGQVFLASSLAGRMVAVKVIHADLARDPDFVRRFRNEVAAAQQVSGWYTAPVVAAGTDGSTPWLATAFVPGPSLDDVVSKYGPMPPAAVWRLAAGLAEALRAIHATGLVHRDLKPANVLLAPDGPRVIDFGISRAVADTRLTVTGAVIGTPSYMSPEQVEAQPAGPASDSFSLGSVLAFAASGTAPFRGAPGASSAAVMYRIVHGEPDLAAVPGDLRGLVEACLAKDPGQRPDLGRVAAFSTSAAERLGLSPAAFWPPEVAQVIQAQQAALTAQVEALQAAPPAPASSGPSAAAGASGYFPAPLPSAPTANGFAAPAPTGPPSGPSGTGYPGAPSTGFSPAFPPGPTMPPAQPWPASPGGPRGTSRRGVLIGAGVGGVAVLGGVLGWVLSDRSPGTTTTGGGTGTGLGSGVTPTATSLGQYYGTGPRRTAAWRYRTGNAVDANPGAGSKMAYVGSSDGNVYAVSLATGQKAWSSPVASVVSAPEAVGRMVILCTEKGELHALHAATGKPAWAVSGAVTTLNKRAWTSAAGQVILARSGAMAQAYDAATGAKTVGYSTQEPYVMTLAAAGGVLYALDALGVLYAFQVADGTELWHQQLLTNSDTPGTSLAVAGGSLFVGTTAGTLYGIGAAKGKVNWTYHPGSGMESDLSVAGGVVYLRDNNGTLHAVSAANGKKVWVLPAADVGFYGLAAAGGRVYFSTALALQALDAGTGKPAWAFGPGGTAELLSTPAVASGLVLVGCHDDSLYAVKA